VGSQFPLADARAAASAAVIAFETIEGPPAQVVGRLVNHLTEETAARQIAVVPREDIAAYRIRGYLAFNDERQGSIAWAWDVYDADQRRAFRLTGTEPGGRRGWSSTDDGTLRKIARASVEQLVAFIASARAQGTLAYAPAAELSALTTSCRPKPLDEFPA